MKKSTVFRVFEVHENNFATTDCMAIQSEKQKFSIQKQKCKLFDSYKKVRVSIEFHKYLRITVWFHSINSWLVYILKNLLKLDTTNSKNNSY